MANWIKGNSWKSGSSQPASCNCCPLQSDRAGGCIWANPITADFIVNQVDLPPDQTLLEEGSRSESVWILRSGILRSERFGFDGRRQILSLILPGELVGHDPACGESFGVATATSCTVCRIDRRLFAKRLESSPDLRRAMYLQEADQLDQLRWLTWAIGALRPDKRLCAFLALSTRFMPFQPMADGSGMLTMQISRSDIADLLATTAESISRITHRLADAGILMIKDAGHFQIVDLQTLIAMGHVDRAFRYLPFGRRPYGKSAAPGAGQCIVPKGKTARALMAVNELNRPGTLSTA